MSYMVCTKQTSYLLPQIYAVYAMYIALKSEHCHKDVYTTHFGHLTLSISNQLITSNHTEFVFFCCFVIPQAVHIYRIFIINKSSSLHGYHLNHIKYYIFIRDPSHINQIVLKFCFYVCNKGQYGVSDVISSDMDYNVCHVIGNVSLSIHFAKELY